MDPIRQLALQFAMDYIKSGCRMMASGKELNVTEIAKVFEGYLRHGEAS